MTQGRFAFRPLAKADLPLFLAWCQAPHAARWFGRGRTAEEILAEYEPAIAGEQPIRPFLVSLGGLPIGMIQWERMGDFPDFQAAYQVDDPDTANCDVIIGDPDYLHRGLGASMIRQFLAEIVFADRRITGCVIDPDRDNAIAIRAYEKAGFRFLRDLADDGEGNPVRLLDLRRGWLPLAAGEPILRPARPDELDLVIAIDDDASTLFTTAGLDIEIKGADAFFAAEQAEWRAAIDDDRLTIAMLGGEPAGFVGMGFRDEAPYILQLAVRVALTRRGVGSALARHAIDWSRAHGEALWLTTYAHIAWNRPYYQRLGFVAVDEAECGPELRASLAAERGALPAPEQRVAMVLRHR